jgi:hypothetical protein
MGPPLWQRRGESLSKSKVKIMLQPTVNQSFLVSNPHLGPKTRFLLLLDSCGFVDMGHPLWQEDRSAVYNCWWPSPGPSFTGPSPAGSVTILYCLRFETSLTWRATSPDLYPPGTGWTSYIPRHWVPFFVTFLTRPSTSPECGEAFCQFFLSSSCLL